MSRTPVVANRVVVQPNKDFTLVERPIASLQLESWTQPGTPLINSSPVQYLSDGAPPSEGPADELSHKLLSVLSRQQLTHESRLGQRFARFEQHLEDLLRDWVEAMGDAALSVAKMSQGGAKLGGVPTNFAAVSAKFAETFRSSQGQTQTNVASAKEMPAGSQASQEGVCTDADADAEDEHAAFKKHASTKSLKNSEGGLAPACSTCGNVFMADAAFCRKCGTKRPQVSVLAGTEQALDNLRKELREGKSFKNTFSRRSDYESEQGSVSCWKCVKDRVANVVQTNAFEAVSCALIFTNAFMIGAEINFELLNPSLGLDPLYKIVNMIFVVAFTLELCLRILAKGMAFCDPRADGFYWHMFDSILVFVSLVEEAISGAGADINMSVLRLFRTLRLMRSFRIIRVVQAFRDLRLMMRGIMNSLKPLMWAGGLLLSIMYLVAICLLQFVCDEVKLQTKSMNAGALDEKTYVELREHFGTVFQTIFTLYACISGGVDWADAATPIMALSPVLGFLFLIYIAFAVLCVLNIITGVFVENAARMSTQDDEMVLMEQMEARKVWMREVQELFMTTADVQDAGTISAESFNEMVQDVRLQAWFQKLGIQIEAYSAGGLFELLDYDGDGQLELDEFLTSLQSVHGTARSIDVARIQNDVRKISKELRELGSALRPAHAGRGDSTTEHSKSAKISKAATVVSDVDDDSEWC